MVRLKARVIFSNDRVEDFGDLLARARLGRKTFLVTFFLILFLSVMPILGLQSSSLNISSYGTISDSTGLLYGVCSHPWVLTERDFQEMKELGIKYVRMDFMWQDFEPTRDEHGYGLEKYDQFVEWAEVNDLEIVALLVYVPSWLRPVGGDIFTIPTGTDFNDFVIQFGEFVYAIVDHYKESITYFEIWNEPNIQSFWKDIEGTLERDKYNRGEAITKYVTLLKEAYTQAKAANPNCNIITSLSENDYVYVQGMYDNGVKGHFDYLGLHPYFYHGPTKNYDPDYVDWDSPYYEQFPKLKLVRDAMVANGDEGKYIFVTELGVNGKDGPEGPTTETIQADRLKRVFEKINHDPGYPFIRAVIWYQFRGDDGNFGLLHEDYTQRQIYYAYKDLIS